MCPIYFRIAQWGVFNIGGGRVGLIFGEGISPSRVSAYFPMLWLELPCTIMVLGYPTKPQAEYWQLFAPYLLVSASGLGVGGPRL